MSEFETKTYRIAKIKFAWIILPIIYLAYINVFTADVADEDPLMLWGIFGVVVLVMVYISNLAYDHFLRDITSITVGDEGLSTLNGNKSTNLIEYEHLMGPDVTSLGILTRYTFRNSNRPSQQIVFSSLTSECDELIETVKTRMIAVDDGDLDTDEDDES